MRATKYAVALIATLILTSCSCSYDSKYEQPQFKYKSNDVNFEYITDDLMLGCISDLSIYKNYITIVAYDKKDETYIHIYDTKTGNHLASGGKRGYGEGEILYSQLSVFEPSKGELHIFDRTRHSHMVFSTDGKVELLSENHLQLPGGTAHTFPLNDESYLTLTSSSPIGIYGKGTPRIFTANHYLDTLATYHEYPYKESLERTMLYMLFNHADISPDCRHLAIGLQYGCVLETFEIGDEITNTGLRYFLEPEVSYENGALKYENTAYGFSDIELSDSHIYASYDGQKHAEFVKHKTFNNIATFDLTGKPISITNFSRISFEQLYADEPNGNLYAAIENESGEIRIIRIKIDDILPKKQ